MLKNVLLLNRRSFGVPLAKPPVGLLRDPKLLLPLDLHVNFEHCSDFSASFKLRPITSYDG